MAVPVARNTARAIGILGSLLSPAGVRGRASAASSSASIIPWMNSRTRSRKPASIGSNQSLRRDRRVGFRLPDRRLRAIIAHGVVSTGARTPGSFGFQSPGDYATFNSNQNSDGTAVGLPTRCLSAWST